MMKESLERGLSPLKTQVILNQGENNTSNGGEIFFYFFSYSDREKPGKQM